MQVKNFLFHLCSAAILFLSASSFAQTDPFAEPMPLYTAGTNYKVDFPESKVNKPVVMEFFSFGCPHCFNAEGQVGRWLTSKPDNVKFIKIPVSFGRPQWTLFARAYYTAKALKIEDKMVKPFFELIHEKRQPPATIADLKTFFVSIGASAEDFDKQVKSFYVENAIRQADQLARKFKVAGVPDFLINEKYRLVGTGVKSEDDFQALLTGLALKDFK